MADGTFAVLLLIGGLVDLNRNYCRTEIGCLGRTEVTPRIAVSAGEWLRRQATPQSELYLRYDFGHKNGPFGTAVGLSVAEGGETWVGIGQTWLFSHRSFFAELHAMPGLYFDNGGFDLGHAIEFRSGIELGFEAKNGWRYGLSYDHRSNTGIFADENPGLETVQFRVSVPLK